VGASSGNIFIATYSADNNFWVGKPIKDKKVHKSSVVSVKFDPLSGRVVASASTDGSVHITSCYMNEVDTNTDGPFGSVTSFGETLISLKSIGWINFVTFSPSANTLCYATHDCELN